MAEDKKTPLSPEQVAVINAYREKKSKGSTGYSSQKEYEEHLQDPWSPEKVAAQRAWISSPGYKKITGKPATTTKSNNTAKSSGTGIGAQTASETAEDQSLIVPSVNSGVSYEGPSNTPTTETKTKTETKTDATYPTLDQLAKKFGITTEQLLNLYNNTGLGVYGDNKVIVPYRYKHRGYGTIGTDRGYVPNELDLKAMQEQANKMGYEFTGKSRPTFFGGRRVVVKTRFNPATGQIEQHPYSTPDTQNEEETGFNPFQKLKNKIKDYKYSRSGEAMSDAEFGPNAPDYNVTAADRQRLNPAMNRNTAETPEEMAKRKEWEKAHGFAYGGYLPKHQNVGQTGYNWGQAEGFTIPQGATIEGTPNTMGKKGNEKAVWKTQGAGMNPYTEDYLLAAGNIGEGILDAPNTKAYEDKLKKMRTSDYTQVATGKDMGNYVPAGQQYGAFRLNQTTPVFDYGYMPGMAGAPVVAKHGGSMMSPYSYPSTLPALPSTGFSYDNMSMYSDWTQRPVMAYGGSSDGPLGYFQDGGMNMNIPETTLTPQDSIYYTKELAKPMYDPNKYSYRAVDNSKKGTKKRPVDDQVFKTNKVTGKEVEIPPAMWNPGVMKEIIRRQQIAAGEQPTYRPLFWPQNTNTNLTKKAEGGDMNDYYNQGGIYEQDGIYDLTDDEINQIMANGGQVEYID